MNPSHSNQWLSSPFQPDTCLLERSVCSQRIPYWLTEERDEEPSRRGVCLDQSTLPFSVVREEVRKREKIVKKSP